MHRHYHYFILLTVFVSSYLKVLEGSMNVIGFRDYSQSETGSNSGGSFDIDGEYGNLLVPEMTRFRSSDSMRTNGDLFCLDDSPSPNLLFKRKRKSSGTEESLIVDTCEMSDSSSPLPGMIEIEKLKKKRITTRYEEINKFGEIAGLQSSSVTLKKFTFSFKDYPSWRLEPIETDFSSQRIFSSSFSSVDAELISPTPLKNGFLCPSRQKHYSLAALSPESVAFSPIISSSANIGIGNEFKADGGDENENLVFDDELTSIFEGFGLIEIDNDGWVPHLN